MKNIHKTIIDFYNSIKKDPNHRYKSWEHCYSYFLKKNIDIDIACLHLSFYLASWGMYRGSSPLLQKDYLIHKEIVKEIIKYKNLQKLKFNGDEDDYFGKIIELRDFIRKHYSEVVFRADGTSKSYEASDVLISKILLGTLGCVPAYDRYFKRGLKDSEKCFKDEYKGILTLNDGSLKAIVKFYKKHKKEFNKTAKEIVENCGIRYPAMKLIDMYFWNIGFKKDKN